jgi:cytochrome c oxidase assembly protein subunit 15
MVVFLALVVAATGLARRGDADHEVGQRLHTLLVVLVAQAAIGYWQYFTGVPALLVGFHVFGAACVWVAVLRVSLAVRPPAVAPGPGAAAAPSAVPVPPAEAATV